MRIMNRQGARSAKGNARLIRVAAVAGALGWPLAVSVLAADEPAPSGFAPMGYFEENCARCHGPQGSFYGDDFGKNLTDDKLHEVVAQMAEGPAQAPLSPTQLEAEVAYHRALIARAPFVAVVSWDESSRTMQGEATPEAEVRVLFDGREVLAARDGMAWTATVPADFDVQKAQVTARKDGKETTAHLSNGGTHDSNGGSTH